MQYEATITHPSNVQAQLDQPAGAVAGQASGQGLLSRSGSRLHLRSRGKRANTATQVSLTLTHVHGHKALLSMRPALKQLAARSDQLDSAEDLSYFLQKPGLMQRTPHLLVMRRPELHSRSGVETCGALLIHEFRPCGYPTRAYAVSDRSGRGVLLGATEERLQLALYGASHLLQTGAKIVLLTLQCDASQQEAARFLQHLPRTQWAARTRNQATYLQLADTFDATLASLGQKTRSNLRYYRRRAEAELGCTFLPQAELSLQELTDFNRDSTFPMAERILRWRLEVQREMHSPYLMGLRDEAGRWLSLIGGRRFGCSTEILWQMNRDGLPKHSIVSAMRSYHMEHEIAHGAKRLYIEGGTPHSMQNSFQTEPITDVILVRSGLRRGMTAFARRYVPPDNLLAEMLCDPATQWHNC